MDSNLLLNDLLKRISEISSMASETDKMRGCLSLEGFLIGIYTDGKKDGFKEGYELGRKELSRMN